VTLVAQDLLRGMRLKRTVPADDWLHFVCLGSRARHRLRLLIWARPKPQAEAAPINSGE
jgi:hypothetical protein